MVTAQAPTPEISIHALREEGDDSPLSGVFRFQISIHALREEGDICGARNHSRFFISIHALREEGDLTARCMSLLPLSFLSTPSARRATI